MIRLNGKQVSPTMFPDRTSQVWQLGDLVKEGGNKVVWDYEQEYELIHLHQLKMLIDRKEPLYSYIKPSNHLHIPYLPYARQDKQVSDTSTFALRAFAQILNHQGWDKVTAFDTHSREANRWITNFENIEPDLSWIIPQRYSHVIFPDAGACKRYTHLIKDVPVIIGDKTRDQETGYITSYNIDTSVFKTGNQISVIVVDDLCDGGKTFEILGDDLRLATWVDLYVSHGLFSKGIKKLLGRYDHIITTDTRFEGMSEIGWWADASAQNVYYRDMEDAMDQDRLLIKTHSKGE